uniref:Dipeptidyl-peptidase 4 n=1 Tax=Echeneis naucrates TaxID=173247 RepID=A0A665W9H8_ECHNA
MLCRDGCGEGGRRGGGGVSGFLVFGAASHSAVLALSLSLQFPIAKVLLGVFGVAVVATLIAVPTAIYLREEQSGNHNQRSFTLEDVFNSTLKPRSYSLKWISDLEYLYKFQDSVYLYNVQTGNSTVFLSEDKFSEKEAYDYQLSADSKYVAFLSNHSKLWRHSFTATYSLYERASEKFIPNSGIPDEVQYFAWAPQGNKLAYVWDNDVYIKASPASPPQQVTFNGRDNQIFNGIPDWVYEEEMFSSSQGLWWSPGAKFVAYAEFNDTEVHTIEYTWYGDNQYPSTVSIAYPKPGTPNPIVKVFVVDTDNVTKITEHYLASVTWVTDDRIAVQWLKRLQNHLILQIYNFNGSSWDPVEVHSESGWIGRFSPPEPVFAADQNSYYLLKSDSRGYKHIHHVEGVAITSGNWEVIDILKVTADSVLESISVGSLCVCVCVSVRWTKQGTTCLTCTSHGDNCQYNSAYFSHNASFYLLSCRGDLNLLFSLVIKSLLFMQMHKILRIINFHLSVTELWYQMFLPPGFDESKQYPLLIDVYAGPCSQKADFLYRVSWSTYLASTEKIIVASFDGRGSGFQGDKIMHELYQRLGTYEVEDQITAVREFIKMGFIDKERVAIWGWSYGGYVTSMALGSGSGVFKCGMAVAPVSKWEYYDTIYTERYMRQPSENPEGYANTTVTARAKNFHSVQYLLVHGTADDNVHFQQAAEISEALVDEQVDFEAMWYTDKDHGLQGSAYQHVYTHMTHFLKRCFA